MRVDHFAIAVRSLDEVEAFLQRYFPLSPLGGISPSASSAAHARLYQLGHVRLALVESAHDGGTVSRFLEARGEGVHHLALRTSDLAAVESSLQEAGVGFFETPNAPNTGRMIAIPQREAFGMLLLIGETDDPAPQPVPPADRIVAMPGVPSRMVFDHLAAAVGSIPTARAFLDAHFPIARDGGTHRGYAGDFDLSQFELGGFRMELVADASGESFVTRFLARRGPGFHHLSIDVDAIEPILDRMRADGLRIVDEADLGNGYRTAFVSPRSAHGLLIQFWQVPDLSNDAFAFG